MTWLALYRMIGGWRSAVGITAAIALAILLVIQKGETRHWRKQSNQFEQLYSKEQTALAATVANYRAAAEAARAADKAATERVVTEQHTVNERTSHDFEARIADARARAQRLRFDPQTSADSRPGGTAPMPGLSAATSRPPQAADQNRLSQSDALTATEQAIQLDELIKWIKAQATVDPNGGPK